jgi:hypothetical protein
MTTHELKIELQAARSTMHNAFIARDAADVGSTEWYRLHVLVTSQYELCYVLVAKLAHIDRSNKSGWASPADLELMTKGYLDYEISTGKPRTYGY